MVKVLKPLQITRSALVLSPLPKFMSKVPYGKGQGLHLLVRVELKGNLIDLCRHPVNQIKMSYPEYVKFTAVLKHDGSGVLTRTMLSLRKKTLIQLLLDRIKPMVHPFLRQKVCMCDQLTDLAAFQNHAILYAIKP